MADIKTKKKQEFNIKKFDRATIIGKNLKENIVNIKDKTKESYEDNRETVQDGVKIDFGHESVEML